MTLTRILPILFGILTPFAQGAAPSGDNWFTLTTPHFRVHHTAALETYARHYAFSLERALPLLEKSLHWEAPKPIDVVVMDTSDSANGLAMSFPNTHIEVFSAPFDHDSPLAYYHDWVDELAVHELTHIIANDSALGFYLTLRKIFGSWVKPNGLQPSWLSEGLAVYQETAFTSAGRGRSPWMDALLREAVRSGKLNDPSYTSLDRFNDGNPWWPGGSTPYLMGYTIQALAAEGNSNVPGELSYNNAGLVPYQPDRNARQVVGRDWASIWAQASKRLAERYAQKTPATAEPCFLTQSGRQTGGHALSPDGWIYFSEEDYERGQRLSRVRADAPCGQAQVERLFFKKWGGPSQVSVSEDGKTVAFAASHLQFFERHFSDIYLWHRDENRTEQLTEGARAREPAFAGPYLLYVHQKTDTSPVIRRHLLATGEEKDIFVGRPLERISGLYARGDLAVFSRHDNDGQEKLIRLSIESGKAEAPIENKAARVHEKSPFITADDSILFAGTADRGPAKRANTQSIYRLAKGKVSLLYSAASGFAERPTLLADGQTMIVQEYHLGGMDLARVPLDSSQLPPESESGDLHEFLTGEEPLNKPAPTAAQLSALGASEPYRATSTPATSLWPQYWLPEISSATEGFLAGASTSGNDPLEHHRYGLLAQYDSRASFPTYRAFYENRTQRVNFYFEANQSNSYFSSTNESQRFASYSGQAILPIGPAFYALGGAFQERSLFGRKSQSVILFQNFAYDRTGKTPAAIDPNFGESLRVYFGIYPNAKNEKLFVDARPKAAIHRRGFQPSHSVGLLARAGITTNHRLASNYYLGGGLSVLDSSDFVVRGYPLDTLFGQKIATANFSYTMPIFSPYRGIGTNPIFLKEVGLRFLADAGSANYLAVYRNDLFSRYMFTRLGDHILTGVGVDAVTAGSVFYHVPLNLTVGLHYGLNKEYGGGPVFFFGLNVGLDRTFAQLH